MTAARNEAMIITVLTAQSRTGKSYSLRDGVLEKTSVATAKGRAVGVPVDTAQDLAELLRKITGDPRSVLIPGVLVAARSMNLSTSSTKRSSGNCWGRTATESFTVSGRSVIAWWRPG